MQFRLSTDLSTALPESIEFNHEELKAKISERLAHYNALVITEDTIKEGKEDRAKLNKLYKAMDDERKAIKKKCLAPYEAFEVKAKEVLQLISEPIAAIDAQLAAFEDKRKAEKRAEIEAVYADIVPDDIKAIFTLDKIFCDKWLNATAKMGEVEESISKIVKRARTDLAVLATVAPEYAVAVREEYSQSLDLDAALKKLHALKIAAETFKLQSKENIEAEEKDAAQPEITATAPIDAPEPDVKLYTLRLSMTLTKGQADALKQFLNNNHITYEKI